MEGTDRISQLPEPILEHILSFLVAKDAAKTSILSKVWYNAWTSLSCLDFESLFLWKDIVIMIYRIVESRKTHKISIRKFRLSLSTNEDVENLIELLVACNIKELSLNVFGLPTPSKAIFAAKALNVLRLGGFKLELPSDGIKFSSLRELHLEKSILDEQLLQALFATCNDLEVLSLSHFEGLTSLQVAGTLPKLRTVRLDCCSRQFHNVDIAAPNLTYLSICDRDGEIKLIKITACKNLNTMNLYGAAVTDKWVEQLFSCLPNLETVYLAQCALLKTMNISSDRLKRLEFLNCNNVTLVDLSTPNLLRFSWHVRYGNERYTTFKLNASRFLEAVLYLFPETIDTNWYFKLTESLGDFNHSGAIELKCKHDKVIVIPKEMRKNMLPPLHGTKHLYVNFWNGLIHSVVDVVDSLLWTSPQLDTLRFGKIGGRGRSKILKFIYRDAADEDEKPCCAALPWKCWMHELKKVKLQNFTYTELHDLRDYFHRNTDILEIIEVPLECSI